ncbi:MAG: tetratricopeptide repeat protein [Isosphaeraceae bacterium]
MVESSSPEMPALAERGDRYELFGEIARGGMGAILKGRDADLGRDLAVKVLLEAHTDKPELLRRFVEEAQIGGQLQHPGIVPVYELGTFADRRPYFTMKLVKGRTLATLLGERGRVGAPSPSNSTPGADATGLASDLPRFLAIFEQVAQTVAYAHARNVIHRDLKPSNVMVGSFGEVQVMDWGLAKVLKDEGVACEEPAQPPPVAVSVIRTLRSDSPADESQSGSVLGTPAYMAPEQAGGDVEQVDRRADVFGLGSILCEMLTGQPAYIGRTSQEVMRKALRGDTADAFARLDGCGADAELAALAKDCLACEPQDRPRDAGVVARRMTAYLAGVQERLRLAELAQVEAHARAEEEAKRRVLSEQLAVEAQGRAEEAGRRVVIERQRRRYQLGLAASVLVLTAVGGLSFTYWAHERQARAARTELALKEATLLRDQAARAREDVAKWQAAAREIELAGNALAEGGEPQSARRLAALRNEVQAGLGAARRDRTLLDALADVRTSKEDLGTSGADAAYARAFREAGLDVDGVPPAEVGAVLKARTAPVAVAVAAALDDWALVRWLDGQPAEPFRRPLDVARAADADPFRDKVRAAILEPDVKAREAALRTLAADPEAPVLPPPSAVLLATALRSLKAVEPAVALLRAVVGRHPDDVWANYVLADALRELRPAPREEAVRYYTAARSLRPETAHALAHLLDEMGRGDEALAVFADLADRRPDDATNLTCYCRCLKDRGRRKAGAIIDRAVAAGRAAIRLEPDSATAHGYLGTALCYQGKLEEAIEAYREAIRLEPDRAAFHVNLGALLCDEKHDYEGAIAEFREAIRLNPDSVRAHHNLGVALQNQGRLDEAIAEHREAIRLKPDDAGAHRGLGHTLSSQGKLDEATSEYRQAIRLRPEDVLAHKNLGYALLAQGKRDEAITEYRQAIRLKPDDAAAHEYLGTILCDRKHDYEGAIAEFREAIRLKPDFAEAHHDLGAALYGQGMLDDAIAELREAIRLKPADAEAHCNLGHVLRQRGDYAASLAELRKGHELGSKQPGWRKPSAQWVAEAERLAELASRLPAILRNEDRPKDAAEGAAFAQMGYDLKQFAAAARLWADALAVDPKLGDDREAQHRYSAACAAALAAAGAGKDDPPPTDAARAILRQQALDWLKAERDAWAKLLETGKPEARATVAQTLEHWQKDTDLAGVREPSSLAKLPDAEQKAWHALWEGVESLLKKAQSTRR